MHKITFLPLDERPCNYDFPNRICKIAKGYKLVRPSKEIMGQKKTPAKFEGVRDFVLKNAAGSDAAIIALDTLLYGGIVPSRSHHLSLKDIKTRLNVIKEIKRVNPKIKLYVFSLILRCPCYSTNDEEPDYYGEVGYEIWQIGVLKNKLQIGLISQAEYEEKAAPLIEKTAYCLKDFETRRETNRNALVSFFDMCQDYVDYFVIPQDDSSPYGYTTMDREYLKREMANRNMHINMYPGADEVGMVLLARATSDIEGKHPAIKVIYPQPECENLTPMYEDRPIGHTLPLQLDTIGMKRDDNVEDLILYMNYPVHDMVNMGSKPSAGYEERNLSSFVSKISEDVHQNKTVLLCDGAYGNGGEKELLSELQKHISLFDLAAYAGWNTSSNSLGTVLAEGLLVYLFGKCDANDKFLAERFYEDVGYCGHVRWHVWHDVVGQYGYNYDYVGGKNGIIAKITKKEIQEFFDKEYPEVAKRYRLAKCQMPWQRIFEADITAKKQ